MIILERRKSKREIENLERESEENIMKKIAPKIT
jgi:hypothetical protein